MLLCSVLALFCALVSSAVDRQYLNEWAVEIPGGRDNARSIADEFGYELVRQVSQAKRCVFSLYSEIKHLSHTSGSALHLCSNCMFVWLCNAFIHSNTVALPDLICSFDLKYTFNQRTFA